MRATLSHASMAGVLISHHWPPLFSDAKVATPPNPPTLLPNPWPNFLPSVGYSRVVVESSHDLVDECFTTNDVILSNWPCTPVDNYAGYDHSTLASVPYGHCWHSLCCLATQETLNPTRINTFHEIRQDEVKRTLLSLITRENRNVELRSLLFELIFNVIMRMLVGKWCSEGDIIGKAMVSEFFEHAQNP